MTTNKIGEVFSIPCSPKQWLNLKSSFLKGEGNSGMYETPPTVAHPRFHSFTYTFRDNKLEGIVSTGKESPAAVDTVTFILKHFMGEFCI